MSRPEQLKNGRVIVTRKENFVEWCAWREWLHIWAGQTLFLEKLVVWNDWPPENQPLVDKILGELAQPTKDSKCPGYPCAPNAQPWQRWSLNQRLDCERRHREDFGWNPPLPATKARVHTKRGAPTDAKLEEWWAYQIERLPKVMKGETMRAYRLRNNFKSPEHRRVRWEETPAANPEENLTPERKAQLARLRELAGVRA